MTSLREGVTGYHPFRTVTIEEVRAEQDQGGKLAAEATGGIAKTPEVLKTSGTIKFPEQLTDKVA